MTKTNAEEDTLHKIIRGRDMRAVTGYSLDHIHELVRLGQFPKPVKLGERASGWLATEVAAWQRERIAARDGKAA